jgi:hypothetical protein
MGGVMLKLRDAVGRAMQLVDEGKVMLWMARLQ